MNLYEAIQEFDLIAYLDFIEADYKESGKNIGYGCVGIVCPQVGCDDNNYHFNIHVDKKLFNCWVCERAGNLVSLVKILEEVPSRIAKLKIINFVEMNQVENIKGENVVEKIKNIFSKKEIVEEEKEIVPLKFPKSFVPFQKIKKGQSLTRDVFINFVWRRNYNDTTLTDWNVYMCVIGKWRMRLIFPVCNLKGELMSYVGKDVTGNSYLPYKTLSNKDSALPIKNFLFGGEHVKKNSDYIVLCEGVFDAMRVGKGCGVASLGTAVTTEQRMDLIRLKPKILYIMFDKDAIAKGLQLAKDLSSFLSVKNIILRDDRDPADLNYEEIMEYLDEKR